MLRRLKPPPADDGTVSRYKPANARTTPAAVQRFRPRFQNRASSTGTSTTETPVRKADFDGVVYFRPTVCSSLPMKRKTPTSKPERNELAVRRPSSRQKTTASTTAA